MKVDVPISQELLNQAQKLAGKTAEETVNQALIAFIKSHNEIPARPQTKQKLSSSIHPSAKHSPFFGQYLVQNQIVKLDELNAAIQFMRKNNPRVGDLAVQKKYLSAQQAQELHKEQRSVDMFFGDQLHQHQPYTF